MHHVSRCAPGGLWLVPLIGLFLFSGTHVEAGCANHGTSVQFLDSPSEAAHQALKEEKLVFVLHVSGQFEDPGLT